MKLKLEIKIINEENDEVIWTDWALGDELDLKFSGMFESAEEILGKMERNLRKVLTRDYKAEVAAPEEEKKLDCGCSDVPNGEIVESTGTRICGEHQAKYRN